jgi:hypothetical protein
VRFNLATIEGRRQAGQHACGRMLSVLTGQLEGILVSSEISSVLNEALFFTEISRILDYGQG